MERATFVLMLITIFSKFTGAIREVIFGSLFGTGAIKDIYVISQSVAALSFSFLFMSIQSTFIPMYNNVRRRDGRAAADRFTSNLTNTFVLIACIASGIFFIFMPQIIHIMAAGFTGEKFEQAVLFTRIVIFQIIFSGMNGTMIAYLNNAQDFVTPATTGIIMNVVIVFFSYLTAMTGNMYVLAVGSVASMGIQYIFFPRALRRLGYQHRPILKPFAPDIKSSLGIALPAMASILVNDLSIIVDKAISTTVMPNGGPSALDYATKLYMLVQGIVIVSITTTSFTALAAEGEHPRSKKFKDIVVRSLVTGLVLVIPATVGMMLFSEPLVRLFYERNAFTPESTLVTASALFWYAPGLIGMMFSSIFVRSFYAVGDTRTPFIISSVHVAVDVILNFVLSAFMGLNGLAASTMIGDLFSATAFGIVLHKKYGSFHYKELLGSTGKIALASAVMGALALAVFHGLPFGSETPRLLVTILVAALVYGVIILFAGIPEVKRIVNQVYHKLHRGKGRR
ncbi:MAG: murein biosynthesis integral membrane protein MurJ [Peptoniphilaceae bacterium]|nr:murein biosynthesis integral membrane protein MurJ [Peptoniphilaceae bacterium]MDY6085818.1 murein biosynthesis integral membrane protein MurJ [Peptoniphilaceae bacterium]